MYWPYTLCRCTCLDGGREDNSLVNALQPEAKRPESFANIVSGTHNILSGINWFLLFWNRHPCSKANGLENSHWLIFFLNKSICSVDETASHCHCISYSIIIDKPTADDYLLKERKQLTNTWLAAVTVEYRCCSCRDMVVIISVVLVVVVVVNIGSRKIREREVHDGWKGERKKEIAISWFAFPLWRWLWGETCGAVILLLDAWMYLHWWQLRFVIFFDALSLLSSTT